MIKIVSYVKQKTVYSSCFLSIAKHCPKFKAMSQGALFFGYVLSLFCQIRFYFLTLSSSCFHLFPKVCFPRPIPDVSLICLLLLFHWASLVAKTVTCQCKRFKRRSFSPWVKKIPWGREQLLTPVFLSGGFHGQRSLAGYGPRGRKGSDITEQLTLRHNQYFSVFSFQ